MYIIDKHSDFYDYISHVYGVDKNIVFDRRGSTTLDDYFLVNISGYRGNRWFTHYDYLLLETGYVQYLIEVSEVKIKYEFPSSSLESAKFRIEKVYEENKNIFSKPLTITGILLDRDYRKNIDNNLIIPKSFSDLEKNIRTRTDYFGQFVPILADTSLTKILDPFEVWKNIQTYISSLGNDKDISIPMSEKEKVESHGFDKNSFRNPIKL